MLDRLRVLIADDHPLFRDALGEVVRQISRDCSCLEAASLAETLDLAGSAGDLDLILLDLMMPGMDGIAGLTVLRHEVPAVPIVVVSAKTERAAVMEAISHGAIGFITKTSPRNVMVKALLQVLEGGIYLPTDVVRQFEAEPAPAAESAAPRVPRDLLTTLTRKQLLVLERLAKGESNKQIARALSLAEPTVKAHVSAILRKLNVQSRASAIVASSGIDFRNLRPPNEGDASSSKEDG
jgi:DNA-binding NarL/FixJ family response regulator